MQLTENVISDVHNKAQLLRQKANEILTQLRLVTGEGKALNASVDNVDSTVIWSR